jgi:hypothetical protein
MVSRREALYANVLATRRTRLLNAAKRRAPVQRTRTVYTNRKGRPIYQTTRVTYVVLNGPRVLYGRKAHRPLALLRRAPYQIRPVRRR